MYNNLAAQLPLDIDLSLCFPIQGHGRAYVIASITDGDR